MSNGHGSLKRQPNYCVAKGAKKMKKAVLKFTLVLVFLIAGGATSMKADGGGGEPPLCYPKACPGR